VQVDAAVVVWCGLPVAGDCLAPFWLDHVHVQLRLEFERDHLSNSHLPPAALSFLTPSASQSQASRAPPIPRLPRNAL
jgi:hypothetical protein